MNKIHKYPLPDYGMGEKPVKMPKKARILMVGIQKHKPFIWAIVDPKHPCISRVFVIASTGFDTIPTNYHHIGSFIDDSIGFVGHVFEVLKK